LVRLPFLVGAYGHCGHLKTRAFASCVLRCAVRALLWIDVCGHWGHLNCSANIFYVLRAFPRLASARESCQRYFRERIEEELTNLCAEGTARPQHLALGRFETSDPDDITFQQHFSGVIFNIWWNIFSAQGICPQFCWKIVKRARERSFQVYCMCADVCCRCIRVCLCLLSLHPCVSVSSGLCMFYYYVCGYER